MYRRFALAVVVSGLLVQFSPASAFAAQMEGKIVYITNKFKTFQLESKSGQVEIFNFGKDTGSLKPNDMVRVTYTKGKGAKGIVKATAVTKLYGDGGVSPEQFAKLREAGAILIDVRNDRDAKSNGIITGAKHIPLDQLESSLGSLSNSKKTIVYCNSGPIAAIGYTILKNNGFKDVSYLEARVYFKDGQLFLIK